MTLLPIAAATVAMLTALGAVDGQARAEVDRTADGAHPPASIAKPAAAPLATNLIWAREAFNDPARWSARVASAKATQIRETLRLRSEVEKILSREVRLDPECGANIDCFGVLEFEDVRRTYDKSSFEISRLEAEHIVRAALLAAEPLDREAQDATVAPAERLKAFGRRDQALRAFFIGLHADPDMQSLSDQTRNLAILMIRMELRRRDLEAKIYLADYLDAAPWPDAAKVGEPAARAAWLIAQHADRDPAFQARALKALETPRAREGLDRDYAFLYDRVMVATGGQQRFGTQTICVAHRASIAPVEEPSMLDVRRARLRLPPIQGLLGRSEAC